MLRLVTSSEHCSAGLFFVLPCVDDVRVVDLRTVTFDVPPQEILTKDSVTARVDAVVYFRIRDPIDSIVKVENAYNSTYRVAQTSLRDVLGTKNLSELLSDRETISEQMGVGLFVCLFVFVKFAIKSMCQFRLLLQHVPQSKLVATTLTGQTR